MSLRRLHHKTFQKHLKAEFRPAGEVAAAHVFSKAVAAVREVYSQMKPTPTKNVTVVYDGTWTTRAHLGLALRSCARHFTMAGDFFFCYSSWQK